MDPSTAGYGSLGMQGVGAVFGALGAFMSAQGNQAMLRGQAEIAEINAKTQESNAQAMLFAGQRQEQSVRLRTAGIKSRQRAGFAAGGIDLGQGSAARVITDTDIMGEMDANQVKANAVREAWGYRVKAVNLQNDALMKRAAADSISPGMAGASSLLGSAGQVAQNWYQMDKVGTFGNGSGTTKLPWAGQDVAPSTYWG